MQKIFDKILHKFLRIPYRLSIISDQGYGQPIIFLHGIASSSSTWNNVLPLVPASFRSITIDLLGFGASPKPTWSDYSITDHAAAIIKTINKLHLKKPIVIVGHSMGGLIAVEIAKQNPRLVKHLILCSIPIYSSTGQDTEASISKMEQMLLNIYQALRERPKFTLKNAARINKITNNDELFEINAENWVSFAKSLQNTIENQSTASDIAKLDMPTDIIYGSLDVLLITKHLRDTTSNRNVHIHKIVGGHDITTHYAQKIITIILDA